MTTPIYHIHAEAQMQSMRSVIRDNEKEPLAQRFSAIRVALAARLASMPLVVGASVFAARRGCRCPLPTWFPVRAASGGRTGARRAQAELLDVANGQLLAYGLRGGVIEWYQNVCKTFGSVVSDGKLLGRYLRSDIYIVGDTTPALGMRWSW